MARRNMLCGSRGGPPESALHHAARGQYCQRRYHHDVLAITSLVPELGELLQQRVVYQYLRQLGGVACMVHAPKCSHVGHGPINHNRLRHFRKPCEGFHHILPAPEPLFCQP